MIRVGEAYQHLVPASSCLCCQPQFQAFTARAGAKLSRRAFVAALAVAAGSVSVAPERAKAEAGKSAGVLFEGVRVFDGRSSALSAPTNVLVVGNTIRTISPAPIDAPADAFKRISGKGRVLTPGFIDAHAHIMFEALSQSAILTADLGYIAVAAAQSAHDLLMRGFTSIRDAGGPSFGLKRGIDDGLAVGPRIWPSGAFVSQSGGHGDYRMPTELPATIGALTHSEKINAAVIADGPDAVTRRVREQLALGASQIKMMAGGGVSSSFDPLDVTQYTPAELSAGVQAAENWGTYVMVHAYTPRAIRQALEAGVRCIEHGQLIDEKTAALIAKKDAWWSLQPFLDDEDAVPFPEGSASRKKLLQMTAGTDVAYKLAKQYGIKTAWGADTLFDAKLAARRGRLLAKLTRWYKPAEILKMATSDNAELLALSGPRNPYPGKLGVVEEGALADLILMDGDPIADISVIERPDNSFLVVMKDGVMYKNAAG